LTTQPVSVQAVYNAQTDTVSLLLTGRPQFTYGGQIVVNASPPSGITDSSGNYLDGNDEGIQGDDGMFIILPKARRITRQ
jgi:hypothetical protein